MIEKIQKTIQEIKPLIAQHLGDIEFVKFENGIVYVRLLGACEHCPLSQLTLKAGVEEILKSKIEGIKSVEAIS